MLYILNTISSRMKFRSRVEVCLLLGVDVEQVFFWNPNLNWGAPVVDESPPVNLSASPVQIETIGTHYIHLPSFTNYLMKKHDDFSENHWKSDQKLFTSSWMYKTHELHHDLWQLHCTNVCPSPFHQCKVTLNTISPRMKSTPRVEVCLVTCCKQVKVRCMCALCVVRVRVGVRARVRVSVSTHIA